MFVQNLNGKQQAVMLHLVTEIMGADEKLHESEQEIFDVLVNQVGDSVSPEAITLNDMALLFDTNISKASLLLELIGVAHADGEYHNAEKALINKYASSLGVSEEKQLKLEQWVAKQFMLTIEVQELLI